MTNANTTGTTPENETLTDRAKGYAASAQEKVSSAASATLDAAKEHPYAAAGIAAGVAAAVGGAAYAATRMADAGDTKAKSAGK